MVRSALRRVKNGLKRRAKKVLVKAGLRDEDVSPVTAPSPAPAAPVAAAPAAPAPETPVVAETPVQTVPEPEPAPEPAPVEAADDSVGPPILGYDEVYALIDSDVRPALQMDGGDIELVKVENNDVFVRLLGACSSCPSSTMTMRMGIERLLAEEFPHMRDLIQVEDQPVEA